jgi:hypothetical protein
MLPMTLAKLEKFGDRSEVIVGRTPDYATKFDDNFFDYIYIDANHSYMPVYQDLLAWWPKLKSGGLFCGDDYTDVNNPGEGKYGVVEAVDQFGDENGLTIYVTGAANSSLNERHRVARGFGKIIDYGLRSNGELVFGTSSDNDDFRIPNWFMFKG